MKLKIFIYLLGIILFISVGLFVSKQKTDQCRNGFYEWVHRECGITDDVIEQYENRYYSLRLPITQEELIHRFNLSDEPFKKHVYMVLAREHNDTRIIPKFFRTTDGGQCTNGSSAIGGISAFGSFYAAYLRTNPSNEGDSFGEVILLIKTRLFGL